MTLPSYQIPILGNPSSSEDPKIHDALQQIFTILSGEIDSSNVTDASLAATDLAASETYRDIGGTGNPAFQNSWVSFDTTTFGPASFYKDIIGVVHLRGTVKSGTANTAIFTLPAGYRPAKNADFAVKAATGTGIVRVSAADGLVSPINTADTTGIALDGISFRAEQ